LRTITNAPTDLLAERISERAVVARNVDGDRFARCRLTGRSAPCETG
jgi:hypothetical protein